MPVTERDRNTAYNKLTETIGPEVADVIMELLPLQPAAELVTRTDLQATTTRLQGEMAELRGEMAELRAELKGEMTELRAELRTEFRTEIGKLYRWGAGAIAANGIAVVTALVA